MASPAGARRRIRDAVEAHLGSREVARVIYGAIIGLALVLAFQGHPPEPGQLAGLLIASALAVGLAELYSEVIGTETRTRRPVRLADLRAMAAEALVVVFGAAFPAVFFLLAAAGVMETPTAFTWSKWTGLVLICGYGYLAGRLSGSGRGRALLHALAIGLVGLALVGLKALLH
ncbi:MAG: hypothetical protein HZB46_11145 [Solirubrobacterales bacterium]|nr:hypothetical protein [Solirubrobacterales bacterium]